MGTIEEFLAARKEKGLLRALNPISERCEARVTIRGRDYIDFSSNDYLGLSRHPRLIEEGRLALEKYGSACSASRLLSGDLELHHILEERIASFKNKEAALIFNSGYQANLGILSSLYRRGDCIFLDRLAHASIIDGAELSGARVLRFRHNDLSHLRELLKKERLRHKKALVVTETIFSMDGDRAPLKEFVRLKKEFDFRIMVDEAHATGIFGANGSGVVEEDGLAEDIDLIMGTFSKALAGFGAYLATSRTIVDYLVNTCRSFIYSTALPPAVIASNIASLGLVNSERERRKSLLESAGNLRAQLENRGLKVRGSSQIVPVIIGDTNKTLDAARILQSKGYWALPIRPPTVPKGESRLRFSLTFFHTRQILENLVAAINEAEI
ncbi:MAG: 8-amino-7-oxononanoate synthase [Candidatus Omnitrophota bacterium]